MITKWWIKIQYFLGWISHEEYMQQMDLLQRRQLIRVVTELLVSGVGLELTNGTETPDNMLNEKQKQIKHLVNEAGFKVVALWFPNRLT
jgi:hypothetical protein